MADAPTYAALNEQAVPSAAVAVQPRRAIISRSHVLIGMLLLGVLLLGGIFRYTGVNWDDYVQLHPDERFQVGVAARIGTGFFPTESTADDLTVAEQVALCAERYPDSNGLGGWFDTLCSPWNPNNSSEGMYVYGTLPLYFARLVAEFAADASTWWARTISAQTDPTLADYDGSFWTGYFDIGTVWRMTSAFAEMCVILIAFCIGWKLHGRWVGLLAAFLYAGTVFSIQQSHFGTPDAIGNLFVALALLFAVCVQRDGRFRDYLLFGLAFGLAVASRFNVVFLFAVILIAAAIRVVPLFDRRTYIPDRSAQFAQAFLGVLAAGIVSLIAFRIVNPYAFMGPSFFGVSLNPRFLEDLGRISSIVSPEADSPPNHQWLGRTSYLFPGWNMAAWGMGLPLALSAIAGLVWSVVRLLRGRPGGTLNLTLIAWFLIYFGYMGGQWVMTMRYYLPLYMPLAALGAWALYEAFHLARARAQALRRALTPRLVLAVGALAFVAGFTLLWAAAYSSVYRNQLTYTQAGHWLWENVPADFAIRVETPENRLVSMNGGQYQTNAVPLIQIPVINRDRLVSGIDHNDLLARVTRYDAVEMPESSTSFTVPADGVIREIFAPHLGDPFDDPDPETLRFTITRESDGQVVAMATLNQNLTRETHITGDPVTIPLDNAVEVRAGERYRLDVQLMRGGPVVSGGVIFTWEGAWDEPLPPKVCTYPEGVTLAQNPPPGLNGTSANCNGRDPWFAFVNGYEQDIVYEDDVTKREQLLLTLDNSDYIGIGTNRRYDTISRNPLRWPMSNVYYDALFSGELGYELVATFQETFQIGDFVISDQVLPTYTNVPDWLNEFESEEAFSVYDHPVVFIFRRTEAYDPQRARAILESVPLTRASEIPVFFRNCPQYDEELFYCDPLQVVHAFSSTAAADRAPTGLMLTRDAREMQREGGTWSERFFRDAPINTSPVAGLALWYLMLLAFGVAAYPLLFALFPLLADRGYSLAKFAGIFIVAWVVWYLASVRIPVWNQAGILAALVGLALVSALVAYRQRATLLAYLRDHWRRLLVIELLTLLLFVGFGAYRLLNPDLWIVGFGGEKPMDFAYFNAVLRSTVFPPYDPWYAGGYINYYYYGFVIIGTPTLLSGTMPSVAFNLILPTLFATTGIAVYGVAYSLVAALRERLRTGTLQRLGNPFAAGMAALLLAVVLGNLDTPRVALSAVAQLGGYSRPDGLSQFLIEEATAANSGVLTEGAMQDALARAGQNRLDDRIRYEISGALEIVGSLVRGFTAIASGSQPSIGTDRWFWAPTRILAETPGVEGSAITEMPAFTFIYADPHAHMIGMPMQLFVMAFVLNEALLARNPGARRRWASIVAVGLAAAYVGMMRATNTWDWITYMLLGAAGLLYAWYMRWRPRADHWHAPSRTVLFSRASVLHLLTYVGGFLLFTFVAVLPYTTWFATSYNSVRAWTDGKTPLWAYFDIHGLFLFLLVSLLGWDTVRWLRSVTVRTLRGRGAALLALAACLALALLAALIAAFASYQVALVAVPLLLWIAVLFFRANQTRAMQVMLALSGLALALTLGVEIVVLDGDIGRQNTVFKFYIQAWLLFSVVGGAAFALLWRASDRWRAGLRGAWTTGLVLLVTIAALFPVMAGRAKAELRMGVYNPPGTTASSATMGDAVGLTLDGQAFIQHGQVYEGDGDLLAADPTLAPIPLEGDYAMITWLQDHVQGSPIIIEGLGDDTQYRWNGRISIYTGLPAVLGWNFHQRQQRTIEPLSRLVELRNANVNYFYETDNAAYAWDMLGRHQVEYVIVGDYERAYYNPAGLRKFERMAEGGLLTVVFEHGNSRIYQVNHDAVLAEMG
jgi:YYY domain-containing protein